MKVLKTIIGDPAELAERLLPDMNNSGIFIPRSTELKVGEDVCVWCVVRSHSAELHLMGVVYWLRHKSGQAIQRLTPGAGIGFKQGYEEQIAFLERVVAGDAQPYPRRRSPRTPLLSPWRCSLGTPETTDARPAMLVDISKGGALVVLGQKMLELGRAIHLALPWHSHTRHEMKVAWIRGADTRWRMGLTRVRSGPSADREWAGLVSEARKTFTSSVWGRSSTDLTLHVQRR
ncbi:MAG: PilZ domain-containing protein [bacterium]